MECVWIQNMFDFTPTIKSINKIICNQFFSMLVFPWSNSCPIWEKVLTRQLLNNVPSWANVNISSVIPFKFNNKYDNNLILMAFSRLVTIKCKIFYWHTSNNVCFTFWNNAADNGVGGSKMCPHIKLRHM